MLSPEFIGRRFLKSIRRSRSKLSFRDPPSRERKRFGEIENRDSRGSVGQGCSESLRVIRLFPSRSSVAPTTTERTTAMEKDRKRNHYGEGRGGGAAE